MRNVDRLRLRNARLEASRVHGINAAIAIRTLIVCADRRHGKGQDVHELFAIIAQIVDLWERDTSPEAWRALLATLQERGVLIPVEAPNHDHHGTDRLASQPGEGGG